MTSIIKSNQNNVLISIFVIVAINRLLLIRELDLESEGKLTDGSGPADECICSLLSPPADKKGFGGSMRDSIKKAFKSVGRAGSRRRQSAPITTAGVTGPGEVIVPLTFEKGGKGIYTTKETVKRNGSCGKCGCDKENIVMKHSYANIKIITPDISSICPCPSDCLPKDKLNNIKVTVEHLTLHPDMTDSEASVTLKKDQVMEPPLERRPGQELFDTHFEEDDDQDEAMDDVSEWSFGFEEKQEQP